MLGETRGRRRRRAAATGTVKASSTPATVACTPEAWTSAQAATASGSSSHGERIRRCTRKPKPAIGSSGQREAGQVQVVGVEDRDDRDRQQVVDHGEGEQEGAQPGRQVGADHREDRDGEGDVGRRRDRPAGQVTVGAEVPERRRRAPAPPCRRPRRRPGARPPRVAQVAGDELALELQAGDEEEDGQQPVGGPGAEAEVEVQGRRADRVVAQVDRRRPATGVFAQTSAIVAADDQQQPAGGLGAQDVGDRGRLSGNEPRCEQAAAAAGLPGRGGRSRGSLRGRRHDCRPDFPAHLPHPIGLAEGRRPAAVESTLDSRPQTRRVGYSSGWRSPCP